MPTLGGAAWGPEEVDGIVSFDCVSFSSYIISILVGPNILLMNSPVAQPIYFPR